MIKFCQQLDHDNMYISAVLKQQDSHLGCELAVVGWVESHNLHLASNWTRQHLKSTTIGKVSEVARKRNDSCPG